MPRILVTGATGQIGSELVPTLRERYGREDVLALGHKTPSSDLADAGPFDTADVRDAPAIERIVRYHGIDTIYHLAAILSAAAAADPKLAWDVNMNGLYTMLEVSREFDCALFFPSSIAAFGPGAPKVNTPQDTIQRPTTLYGVSKVAGELLCDYYHGKFGVDTRGLRYPGLVSHGTPPGGGTTDYAVEIFYAALREKHYRCFLKAGTRLDMMYMPDAVRAAMELMEANPDDLKHRNAFNITAMSIDPEQIAREIRKQIPEFTLSYRVDPVRQGIADSWPNSMDDTAARNEWGWRPEYDLAAMTRDMIAQLSRKGVKAFEGDPRRG
jgi:nucleoside-diphosphate-sugar epimerase